MTDKWRSMLPDDQLKGFADYQRALLGDGNFAQAPRGNLLAILDELIERRAQSPVVSAEVATEKDFPWLTDKEKEIRALTDDLEEALQFAWNDYCGDTGCYPSTFTVEGARKNHTLHADFKRGGMFLRYAAGVLREKWGRASLQQSPVSPIQETEKNR